MRSDWKEISIRDACLKSITGGTPSSRNMDFYDGGTIPWLNTKEVDFCRIYKTDKFITELGFHKSSAKWIPENSVIVAMYGATAGKVALNKIPLTTNQACCNLVIDNKKANYEFIYYYLSNSFSKLANLSNGAAQQNLNTSIINNFPISLPPLQEQKYIAHFLGSLDNKIELNRQMNETLESMAQALFKSWFVDFDPVIDNALAAGNPIPDALKAKASQRAEQLKTATQNGEPPAVNRELFPSEFSFTDELGWIPRGWEVSNVGDEFDVTMGQSPPGSSYNDSGDGDYFFQGSTDFGFRFPSPRIYCTEPKRKANKLDTLVSVRAPVGDINLANHDCCIGRGLAAVRHISGSASFTYYSIMQLSENFKVYEGEGTVFGSINQKTFKSLNQLKISVPEIKLFEEYAGSFDSKIESNSIQIESLSKLRDTLLPKLLSGELRIANAATLVEGV